MARGRKESSAALERDSVQELVKEVKALKKQVQAEVKHSKQFDRRLAQDEEAIKHVAAEEALLKEEHEKQQKAQKRTRTENYSNKGSSKDYKGKHGKDEDEDESDDDEEAYEEEADANTRGALRRSGHTSLRRSTDTGRRSRRSARDMRYEPHYSGLLPAYNYPYLSAPPQPPAMYPPPYYPQPPPPGGYPPYKW